MKFTITIPEPCHENWQQMSQTEKGRFCASCEKEVFDFTRTSNYQMATILKSTQNVCGRFRQDQLDREYSSPHSSRFQRTGLLFGITSLLTLCTPAQAQEQPTKVEQVAFLGDIVVEPEEKPNNVVSKIIGGTVVDENDLPLPGANIVLEGTQIGTQTDFDGNFKLELAENILPKNKRILISYIGFKTKYVCLESFEKMQKVQLVLSEDVLGGLVVVRRNILSRIKNYFRRKQKVEATKEEGQTVCFEKAPIEEIEIIEVIEHEEESINNDNIKNEQKVNFWPNPIKSSLNVSFEMPVDGTFSAYLVPINDGLDKSIHLTNELKSKGNHQETFSLENLESGLYVLVLQTGNTIEKHKVIVDNK